jgi:hypothetical protein
MPIQVTDQWIPLSEETVDFDPEVALACIYSIIWELCAGGVQRKIISDRATKRRGSYPHLSSLANLPQRRTST